MQLFAVASLFSSDSEISRRDSEEYLFQTNAIIKANIQYYSDSMTHSSAWDPLN